MKEFNVGDTIRVLYKIVEGEKSRSQPFEGIVISKKGPGVSKTFTVRRIGADSIGIERIFPLHSPNIEDIKVLKHGKVRRAKLGYLRGRVGKEATKLSERTLKVSEIKRSERTREVRAKEEGAQQVSASS